MDNYFKPINVFDAKEILEKRQFNIDDIMALSKWIQTPLENEFDTTLNQNEKHTVCLLVCKNLSKICQIFTFTIMDNGEKDYLIKKDIMKVINEMSNKDLSKIIPLKAMYFLSNGYDNGQKEYIFEGTIPKKGFFSSRQSITNNWINKYITHLGFSIIGLVLARTNNDKESAVKAIMENTACFLVNSYPEVFDKNSDPYDINIKIAKM